MPALTRLLPLAALLCVAAGNSTELSRKLSSTTDAYNTSTNASESNTTISCRVCHLVLPNKTLSDLREEHRDKWSCDEFNNFSQFSWQLLEMLLRRYECDENDTDSIRWQLSEKNFTWDQLDANLTYNSSLNFENLTWNFLIEFDIMLDNISTKIYEVKNKRIKHIPISVPDTKEFFPCQEKFPNSTNTLVLILFLYYDENEDVPNYLNWQLFWIMLAVVSSSLFGLLITAVTVVILGEHKTVPGLNLLCMTFSLFVSFFCIPTGIFSYSNEHPDTCRVYGVLHVYTLLSGLCWMTVTGFDIWQSLSSFQPVHRYLCSENKTRLASYWAYSWGTPALLLAVGIYLDCNNNVVPDLKPHFVINCWFVLERTIGRALFYNVPISLIFAANLLFFVRTAKMFQEARRMRQKLMPNSENTCSYTFCLHLKLFLMLGMTWIFESIRVLFPTSTYVIIFDIIISLHGVFIFLIFCCNRRIFQQMRQRWKEYMSSASSVTTQRQSIRSAASRQNSAQTSK